MINEQIIFNFKHARSVSKMAMNQWKKIGQQKGK